MFENYNIYPCWKLYLEDLRLFHAVSDALEFQAHHLVVGELTHQPKYKRNMEKLSIK